MDDQEKAKVSKEIIGEMTPKLVQIMGRHYRLGGAAVSLPRTNKDLSSLFSVTYSLFDKEFGEGEGFKEFIEKSFGEGTLDIKRVPVKGEDGFDGDLYNYTEDGGRKRKYKKTRKAKKSRKTRKSRRRRRRRRR